MYIIKSGKCKALKKIVLKKSAKDVHTRVHKFKPVDEFFDNMKVIEKVDSSGEQTIYLELEELRKGDVFGIRDLIFNDILEPNSTMMLSCGVECVLLNRKLFLKSLLKSLEMKLKVSLMPYPSENELIPSYYEYIHWIKYKKQNLEESLQRNKY